MFDLGLKGKVALITGGSDGLGRAAVRLEAVDRDHWREDIDLKLTACVQLWRLARRPSETVPVPVWT